jgi:hypothetical protein
MTKQPNKVFESPRIPRLDPSIEAVEVDFSKPRIIRIIPVNSKGPTGEYILKITPKGGAVLV